MCCVVAMAFCSTRTPTRSWLLLLLLLLLLPHALHRRGVQAGQQLHAPAAPPERQCAVRHQPAAAAAPHHVLAAGGRHGSAHSARRRLDYLGSGFGARYANT